MSDSIQDGIRARKRRNERRLDKRNFPVGGGRVLGASKVRFELSRRAVGTPYGGIGLVHRLVGEFGLAEEIDARLHVLKIHLRVLTTSFRAPNNERLRRAVRAVDQAGVPGPLRRVRHAAP